MNLSRRLYASAAEPHLGTNEQVASVQTLSGTGACRIFADFQSRFAPKSAIYIPVPTWANHHNIWRDAGVPQVRPPQPRRCHRRLTARPRPGSRTPCATAPP